MKKALNYSSYLFEKDENSIVKEAFLISKQLDMENRKSYISELKAHLRETGCYNSGSMDFVRQSTIAHTVKNSENNYVIFLAKRNKFFRKTGFLPHI